MAEKNKSLPTVQEFFAAALPGKKGNHALVVGELHLYKEHLEYFTAQLPALIKNNNLGTLGVEYPPFMNVFLWAYQDGTLTKELGSQDAAKNYLRTAFLAASDPDYRETTLAEANLMIAALDKGIRVVAYDSRDTLEGLKERSQEKLDSLKDSGMRASSTFLDREEMLQNADGMIRKNASYAARVKALETIIVAGQYNGIAEDTLSATLLHAGAAPGKNTIAIIGYDHINGVYEELSESQGTFADTLTKLTPKAMTVTKAVVAGVGMATAIVDYQKGVLANIAEKKRANTFVDAIADSKLPTLLVNFETGKISEMPKPDPKLHPLASLEQRLMADPKDPETWQLVNPLVNTEIAGAAAQAAQTWPKPESRSR